MRVILDTNILVSALLSPAGIPGCIYQAWLDGRYKLLTCNSQIIELRRTLSKPFPAANIRSRNAGRLINFLHRSAEDIDPLPYVARSPDPDDNFLLAMAEAGRSDYLVTGDKHGLLELVRHAGTRIVSAREFAKLL